MERRRWTKQVGRMAGAGHRRRQAGSTAEEFETDQEN